MIRSVDLTPAETLLLKIEQEGHERVIRESSARLEKAVKAIYSAHGWEWGKIKGQMQKDPLDTNIIRFVYEDGLAAPEPPKDGPQLKIVDVEEPVAPVAATA